MKKNIVLFSLGIILFLSALPLSFDMFREFLHTKQMHNRYDIEIISSQYPPPAQNFTALSHSVEIEETIIKEGDYTDQWGYDIAFTNLTIKVNDEKLATLKEIPIRVEEEGVQKYHGKVSFVVLFDKQEDESNLYVIIRNSEDQITTKKGRKIISSPPLEKIKYTIHTIDKEGYIVRDTFSQNKRSALQTILLNNSGASPMAVGYYTDAWHMYPSIFFPILFPFITLIFGLILIIVYFPRKLNVNKNKDNVTY